MSKQRSGLANDRRAYGYGRYCAPTPTPTPTPICPSITNITLTDIATFGVYDIYGSQGWLLNGNTTILLCQVLEIPFGQTLLPNNFTLTNNGTINIRGTLRNTTENISATGNSITINNGTINVFSTGTIAVSVEAGNLAGFANNGVLNNYGDIYCQTFGVVNNNSGGRINNYSAFSGGFRLNANGTFNNSGVFINNTGATITMTNAFTTYGIIYNYGGGTIINNGTITNDGIVNNADGSSTCGVGTITGSGTIPGSGTIGTACPP